MSVFDVLRKELNLDAFLEEDEHLCPFEIAETIDFFEAEHPGLIDKTLNCANCGLPLPNYWEDGSGGTTNNPGWEYVWTFAGPKWLDQSEVEDDELHNIWLCCPACAKEAK